MTITDAPAKALLARCADQATERALLRIRIGANGPASRREERAMKKVSRVSLAFVVTACLIAVTGSGCSGPSGIGGPAARTASTVGLVSGGVDPGFLAALEWRVIGP